MSRIQSVKGVKETYDRLTKLEQSPLTAYASKSPEFREVVKSEKDLMKLYESILLDGSSSPLYNELLASIGGTASERMHVTRKFQEEIRGDIDKIIKNSHMIRTNECPKDKVYYNAKTVPQMMERMTKFLLSSGFYDKLSDENRKQLQRFLEVKTPTIDLTDPNSEEKMKAEIRRECERRIKENLIPYMQKASKDLNMQPFMQYGARVANGQVDPNALPTQMDDLNLEGLTVEDVENLYKVANFMKDFVVEGAFEPEKIKAELCAEDSYNVDSADKSIELTNEDIKMIFANAEKFNKNLVLKPVQTEDIFAEPSDKKLKAKDLTYQHSIELIRSGLQDVLGGASYKTLDPDIARYVRYLANNCPTAEFLPNLGLAEAHNCRLSKGHEAKKCFEPTGEVPRYLVTDSRFTVNNVQDMVTSLMQNEKNKQFFINEDGSMKVRLETVARVMNNEISPNFLTEDELKSLSMLQKYYRKLKPEEQKKVITDKEEYKAGDNTLLSVEDLKILFRCFAANAEENPQFRMFRFEEKDFEANKNGKPGKMLQRFGCSYDEFFEEIHSKYVEAYKQKAIFTTGDDKYTDFIRFVMGYCKDITYAPAVGMTPHVNSQEPIYQEEGASKPKLFPLVVSSEYSNLVLSLPSARDVPALDVSLFLSEADEVIQKKMDEVMKQRKMLESKKLNIEARIKEIKSAFLGKKLSDDHSKQIDFLKAKAEQLGNQIGKIDEILKTVDDKLVDDLDALQDQGASNQSGNSSSKLMDMSKMMAVTTGKQMSQDDMRKMMLNPYTRNMMSDSVSTGEGNMDAVMDKYNQNKDLVEQMLTQLIGENAMILSGNAPLGIQQTQIQETNDEKRQTRQETIKDDEEMKELAKRKFKKDSKTDVTEEIRTQTDALMEAQQDVIAENDQDLFIDADYIYDEQLESQMRAYVAKSKVEEAKVSPEIIAKVETTEAKEEQEELEEIMEEENYDIEELIEEDDLEEIVENKDKVIKKANEKAKQKQAEEEEAMVYTYKPKV